ncbi:hypothetical protein [Trueperella pyogenes]
MKGIEMSENTMKSLDQLIKDAKDKHAAHLKRLRQQAAKEEQQLYVRVAQLFEQHEHDRFAQYRARAAQLIEQERAERAARAKAAREAKLAEQSDESGDGCD